MAFGWFLLCFIALMVRNPCHVVQSSRNGRSHLQGLTGNVNTRIILTQRTTRDYFIRKLIEARESAKEDSRSTTALVSVRNNMQSVLRFNFLGFTTERLENNTFRDVKYRSVCNKTVLLGKGEVSEELELLKHSQAKRRGSHVRWLFSGSLYENDVMEENRELKKTVRELEKVAKTSFRNGRSYAIKVHPCLKITNPTNCYLLFDPNDGVIILSVSRFSEIATMYQLDWNTIATKSYSPKAKQCNYFIPVAYFKKVMRKSLNYLIDSLTEIEPVDPQLLVDPTITRQSSTLGGPWNPGDSQLSRNVERGQQTNLKKGICTLNEYSNPKKKQVLDPLWYFSNVGDNHHPNVEDYKQIFTWNALQPHA